MNDPAIMWKNPVFQILYFWQIYNKKKERKIKMKHCAWLNPHFIIDILVYMVDIDKQPFNCSAK